MNFVILNTFLILFMFHFVFAQTPTAKFSVFPEKFVLEQQFTTKCSVSNFVATDFEKYAAIFSIYFVSTDLNNNKNLKFEMDLAKWTVTKGGEKFFNIILLYLFVCYFSSNSKI